METAEYVTHLECALTNMRAKYEQMIDEKNALCAEVERLREECEMYRKTMLAVRRAAQRDSQ